MASVSLDRSLMEARFALLVSRELNKQRRAVLAEVNKDIPQMDSLFWEEQRESMIAAITPLLVSIYDQSVGAVFEIKGDPIGDLASRAFRWARVYAGDLVRGVTRTTQRAVGNAVATFVSTPGLVVRDLTEMLSTTFGPSRAEAIAVTEFTRAHFEGTREAVSEIRKVGFEMVGIWRTAVDDIVCPICGPLEGMKEVGGTWNGYTPPAHPNCRCDIAYELV